jgi:succinoglycan biosynthesis transport protein ExoP
MNKGIPSDPLPGSKANKPFDVIGFVFRYGLIIVTLGLFILTMLVPVVLKVKKPNFEVYAMLKIDPVIPSLITKSEDPSITGFYHDFVRTQAARISEYDVIAEALGTLTPEQKETQCPADFSVEQCVALLQRIITISPVSRTHLVKLSIQGPKKEGLAPVLNALMATYLEKMHLELEKKDTRRLTYLVGKKETLKAEIQQKEAQLQDFASTVLSSTFTEDFNVWQKRVEELQKSYIHFFGDRVQAENEFKLEMKSAESLRQLSLNALVEEGVMADDAIAFTSSWTYQQLQDLRSSIDGVTAENNDRKRVEQRMDAMRDYEKELRKETRDNLDSIIYGKRDIELQQGLIKKENSYREALANEEEILAELTKAERVSGQNSSSILKGSSLETELDHARELLFRIDTRIHELEAESRAPLRVTVESEAKEPKTPAGSNIKKLLMMCVAFSFGSVGGVFLMIDFFDNRIRSKKTVLHALGHPSTWPISPAPEGVGFRSILTKASGSEAAKAIRSLATRIYREHQEKQARVFLFTAVDNQSGTTSITMNTAQVLAFQSSRVLVIDANIQDWGSGDDGSGEEGCDATFDPLEAVQHDKQKGFDYLVSFMPETSTRYASRMLNRFLSEARERYDFICIDAAPVLQSDLTEYLAANSDAAILIIQGDSTTYRSLRQSAEILVGLDIPALAPVLNWGGEKMQRWFDKHLDALPGIVRDYGQALTSRKKLAGTHLEK